MDAKLFRRSEAKVTLCDSMAAASSIIQPYDLTQPRPRLGSSVSDVDTDVQFEPSYVKTVARLNEFYGQGECIDAYVYKQLTLFSIICLSTLFLYGTNYPTY